MFRGFSRKLSSQDCNILMRILQLSVSYCIIIMRILHFHSSVWSGRIFWQNMHIIMRILQYLSDSCNIIKRILQFWLLSWSFRGLFEVSWPVKYGYSHENIAIVEWELQYSHENIAILTALRPANDRLFTQKLSPKWTPNLVKWVSIFSTFFDAVLEPCFHDFVSKSDPKMVPKKWPFLRPPTLLKYSK